MNHPALLGRDILENCQVDIRRRADAADETEE